MLWLISLVLNLTLNDDDDDDVHILDDLQYSCKYWYLLEQALEVIKQLKETQTIDIQRALMRLRIMVPGNSEVLVSA